MRVMALKWIETIAEGHHPAPPMASLKATCRKKNRF
jgi:hypothetical protein